MATVIESGIGLVNYGRQSSGKGTIATAATTTVGYNRLKFLGGGLVSGKAHGSQNYADGQRFSSPSVFVNYTGGAAGSISLQAQPENIGLFYAQVLGSDVVTGASDPYTHTITPNNAGGMWGTWWQKIGSSVVSKQVFWDCKVAKFTQNSPRDQNVVNLSMDIVTLKPAQVYSTDPAKTEDTSDPYLLTEATSGLTFDGTVIQEIEDSIVEIDCGIEAFYGDQVEPLQLIEGRGDPGITRSIQAIVTDDTLAKVWKALYNDDTPATDVRPGNVVFSPAVAQVFTRSATRTATITNPNMEVDPANFEALAMQVDGGKKAIQFGGRCLKDGSSPAITVVVLSADATTYA